MSLARQVLGLVIFLAITYVAAGIGSLATTPNIDPWYAALPKPGWTPPNWLFGPVWSLLYTLMAIAAWLVWRKVGLRGRGALPLGLYGLQLGLNVLWSVVFFGLHGILAGFIVILLLWAAILATLIVFWRVTPWAGALFMPYLLWVSYASTLNGGILWLTR